MTSDPHADDLPTPDMAASGGRWVRRALAALMKAPVGAGSAAIAAGMKAPLGAGSATMAAVGLLAAMAVQAQAPGPAPRTVAQRTAGLEKQDGFLPLFWDAKAGELYLELAPARLGTPILYFTSLASGVGSTSLFADRGSIGTSGVVRLERRGARVLVVQENVVARAGGGPPALARAVADAVPTSVLASLPLEVDEEGGTLLVRASPLVLRDAFGLLGQLRRPPRIVGGQIVAGPAGAGGFKLDEARSAVVREGSKAFPGNTELESLLTFTTDGEPPALDLPEPRTLSLRQHLSLVAPPPPGFRPLPYDPRVGYISTRFWDFSRPFAEDPRQELTLRWRLTKRDFRPIVIHLDPAIPEPIRSAARRGTLVWNAAFEAAGFPGAIRVEDLPPGADPMDVRYTAILWTNRLGRGWSVGQSHVDPRTGEILHAIVHLDSHRMRTTSRLWRATTPEAPPSCGAAGAELAELLEVAGGAHERAVTDRLATLTAHEVGHILGLGHDFVASSKDRASVMDYYAPRIAVQEDGSLDLTDAYVQHAGAYDRAAIRWGYEETDDAGRERIVREAQAAGVAHASPEDARWSAYDDGPDPVSHLREALALRQALLLKTGPRMLREGEPRSDLLSRFALAYLSHRYALAAAVNVVGGVMVPPSRAGDALPAGKAVEPWPAAGQREALRLLTSALDPERLAVPEALWRELGPGEPDHDPEAFGSSAGPVFSPDDGARAVADIVVAGLLTAERLQRLRTQALIEPRLPGPAEVVDVLLAAAFRKEGRQPLRAPVQAVVVDRLMHLATAQDATAEVQAEAWDGLERVAKRIAALAASPRDATPTLRLLAAEIARFRRDPKGNVPKRGQVAPPPGPPI